MVDLPAALRKALDDELDGYSMRELGRAAQRLSTRYRADHPAVESILATPIDSAAYLMTRMPATYAAARQVFDRIAAAQPGFAPRSLLDIGAGTGACTWAAAETFSSLESSQLIDTSTSALDLALKLLAGQHPSGTGGGILATAHAARMDRSSATQTEFSNVDLAICGFLLGELETRDQDAVVDQMLSVAPVVAVIEPGTPAGYRRVLRARTRLLAAGRHVLAPCPHDLGCPLESTQDWCHFAVRLTRSVRHRQAKGGERGFEDEKYAYVVAATQPSIKSQPGSGRILRHPQIRGGHVRLTVCSPEPGIEDLTVAKRDRAGYRAARKAGWGDTWPPCTP